MVRKVLTDHVTFEQRPKGSRENLCTEALRQEQSRGIARKPAWSMYSEQEAIWQQGRSKRKHGSCQVYVVLKIFKVERRNCTNF